jgi:membrane protein DedA with SNARE-associated domain
MTGEGLAGLSIALFTLVSEDAAVITAGALAGLGQIGWSTAFFASVLGVWLGDLGLYSLARFFGRPVASRLLRGRARAEANLRRSQEWFARRGWFALVVCRLVPGTRLPTYLTAGLLRMPFGHFAAVTGGMALLWVGLMLTLVWMLGDAAAILLEMGRLPMALAATGLLGLAVVWWQRERIRLWLAQWPTAARWMQWEFWPAWLFYFPVVVWYLLLAIRHRSLTLPTCANPGMFTGGIIGESKIATLLDLERTSPEWTAGGFLLPAGSAEARREALAKGMSERGLGFPLVLKPDVGQRGSGFRIARTGGQAAAYLAEHAEPIIAQEFLSGPEEAGIFYCRFPGEECGKVFALTVKVFPVLTGNGVSTIEELVRNDPRARLLASVYLRRLAAQRDRVPAEGEIVRMVAAGNHAQGCIFRDGAEFITPALTEAIDAISRRVDGFFIGRYDVRFSNYADLTNGVGFRILELNGAASEATNAYDASHSLARAYGILFEQWRLVFAVGRSNRKLGHQPAAVRVLVNEWLSYRRRSRHRCISD